MTAVAEPVRAALPVTVARPDPRSLLVAVLLVNVLVLSTGSQTTALVCGVLVIAAHATAGLGKAFWTVSITLMTAAAAFVFTRAYPDVWGLALVNVVSFYVFRFGVAIGIATYVLRSVTPGEMTAALYRLRLPKVLTIPLTVMMRFFPLAHNEFRAVREATALRGIPLGARSWLLHPLRSIEYVLVPMLASCSRIADDLTAAGLVRGLGQPKRPTSVVPLSFSLPDALLALSLVTILAVYFSGIEVIT